MSRARQYQHFPNLFEHRTYVLHIIDFHILEQHLVETNLGDAMQGKSDKAKFGSKDKGPRH